MAFYATLWFCRKIPLPVLPPVSKCSPVSGLMKSGFLKTVMRLLRESVSGFTLESLGFHGRGLDDLHKALKVTTGMILATGPTGSGKTTTLYTMLDIVNTPNVNISTIEDPVEYQMARI